MKTIASQSILLKTFYRRYLQNIIKQKNGTDDNNNNIDDENISSMNNESATLDKLQLLVIPCQG